MRALTGVPRTIKLRMPMYRIIAVRQWGISFIVERETAQTAG